MISSPCKNCGKRHLPKDMCMRDCEKIKTIQRLQHTMSTPPYACDDSSEIFSCEPELPFVQIPGESS